MTLGILDTSLFTLLVLMAVVTTVATGPLLNIVKPDPYLGRPPEDEDVTVTLADLSLGSALASAGSIEAGAGGAGT